MAIYRYKAVTPAGEILEGQMEVASHEEAIAKLQDAGNIPLDVRVARDGSGGAGFGGFFRPSAMRPSATSRVMSPISRHESVCHAPARLNRWAGPLPPRSTRAQNIRARVSSAMDLPLRAVCGALFSGSSRSGSWAVSPRSARASDT